MSKFCAVVSAPSQLVQISVRASAVPPSISMLIPSVSTVWNTTACLSSQSLLTEQFRFGRHLSMYLKVGQKQENIFSHFSLMVGQHLVATLVGNSWVDKQRHDVKL